MDLPRENVATDHRAAKRAELVAMGIGGVEQVRELGRQSLNPGHP